MQLKDWMVHPVHTGGVGTPLQECAETMRSHDIRHLPILDGDGKLSVLLTDFEFELRGLFVSGMWVPFDDSDRWLLAGEVGREPEVVASPHIPISRALDRLQNAYQDCIVVMDNDTVVGILTEHDVVKKAVDLLPPETPLEIVSRRTLPLIRADVTAVEARSFMARKRIRHALVVDDGVLTGVLSYRDVALEEAIENLALSDVARVPVSLQGGELDGRRAARTLLHQKIGCLPIVDSEGRPTAIVTRREILDAVRGLFPTGE